MFKLSHLIQFFVPRLMFGGGGGGGPTTSTTNTSNIPEYARPYTESMLAATQKQLFNTSTDASGNVSLDSAKPYQAFGQQGAGIGPGEMKAAESAVAGPSELQNRSYAMATPEGFNQGIGSYMSPYQQNVIDIQKREAMRQAGIASGTQAAQAAQAGAFGGSRDALMRAQRGRDLATQMNDIQSMGLQAAYDKGTQQYNTGLQQMNTFGQQQQQQQQNILNQAIQNYANTQQYPQQQLAFMSSMLRGLPLQSTTTQSYQAAPSMSTQLAGLGLAGASVYNAANRAKGGVIKEPKRPAGLAELALSKMA